MSRSSALELQDLRFTYEGHESALDGVSLEVAAGERFGIIGPSGAGKSTLLLHLNGLLRGQGRVSIDGLDLADESLDEIRRRVGLIFQNPDDQLFNPTVEEDVAFGPLNMGLEADEVRRRVAAALAAMRLEGFEEKTSHHLSYGERKRVALATVLSMQPSLVALDEPFSNLDPSMVRQLVDIIRGLDATVVVVSQQILPALSFCERLGVMIEGRFEAVGTTREIIRDRALLARCGLDLDYYCNICRSIESGG